MNYWYCPNCERRDRKPYCVGREYRCRFCMSRVIVKSDRETSKF